MKIFLKKDLTFEETLEEDGEDQEWPGEAVRLPVEAAGRSRCEERVMTGRRAAVAVYGAKAEPYDDEPPP